MFATIDT